MSLLTSAATRFSESALFLSDLLSSIFYEEREQGFGSVLPGSLDVQDFEMRSNANTSIPRGQLNRTAILVA